MDEISVLDYLKLKLKPENWHRSILPDEPESVGSADAVSEDGATGSIQTERSFAERWRDHLIRVFDLSGSVPTDVTLPFLFTGGIFAIIAQLFLEPNLLSARRQPQLAAGLYAIAAILILAAFIMPAWKQRGTPRAVKAAAETGFFNEKIHFGLLGLSLICMLIAFFLFGGNRFNFINLTFWALSILFAVLAMTGAPQRIHWHALGARVKHAFSPLTLRLSPWSLLCVAVFALCAFFRLTQLDAVPGDMFSDHAEKLYDVMDVLDGQTSIFFVRNTGREAFQFYWTVLMIRLFGTGISFLSLKIGTALAGLFVLPFVYLLGRDFANRWVGLLAMLLCGVAYWPNVIDRVALRFAFYPMFTAPALYFLLRGLREKSRRDLILSGVALGIGLQGYSAMRIVPFVVVFIFLIYWVMLKSGERLNALKAFAALVFFALLLCLPLIRVLLAMPETVMYRSLTRLSGVETTLTGSPFAIFLSNFWKSLVMPFWDNGRIWVHSIPFRPALDHWTASFFFIGLLLLLIRAVRERNWQDWVLILSIPLLMLPSILSIAFPDENPSLNRSGAAMIPIFCIAAFGFWTFFAGILRCIQHRPAAMGWAFLLSLLLLVFIAKANYRLVFTDYRQNYDQNALNTRQIGSVVRGFASSVGSADAAYVIPYPYWVDTRLVGINAGVPRRDTALDRSQIAEVQRGDGPLLFIYKAGDDVTAALLENLYPAGKALLHAGLTPDKDFISCLVP